MARVYGNFFFNGNFKYTVRLHITLLRKKATKTKYVFKCQSFWFSFILKIYLKSFFVSYIKIFKIIYKFTMEQYFFCSESINNFKALKFPKCVQIRQLSTANTVIYCYICYIERRKKKSESIPQKTFSSHMTHIKLILNIFFPIFRASQKKINH